jgi:integrase
VQPQNTQSTIDRPKPSRLRRITHAGVLRIRYDEKHAESGPGSRMVIRDSETYGLQLRVTPNGVKTFSVYFRAPGDRIGKSGGQLKGKQRRITLGQFPTISVEEAKRQANEVMGAVLEGRDPWLERKQQNHRRYSNRFESVLARFIDTLKIEIESWRNAERTLKLHVEPQWTGLPVSDISKQQVDALVNQIVASGRKGTAREVRKHLHRLFEWAVDAEILTENPVRQSKQGKRKSNLLAANTDAGRALDRGELRAVWEAAGTLGYPFGPWFQLLMLTGQRRADWAEAMRSEIKPESELEQEGARTAEGAADRYVLEIPAKRYKGARNHIVPLVPAAWEIISNLPVWHGNDYALFSGRAGRTPISGYSKAKTRLDSIAQKILQKSNSDVRLSPFRVHDFRVTCRTRLSHLGVSEEIAEAVLGHAQKFLGKVYNKHDYLAQKRAALLKYADWLLELVTR